MENKGQTLKQDMSKKWQKDFQEKATIKVKEMDVVLDKFLSGDYLEKEVKPFSGGTSSYLLMPKKDAGKKAYIILIDKGEESKE